MNISIVVDTQGMAMCMYRDTFHSMSNQRHFVVLDRL